MLNADRGRVIDFTDTLAIISERGKPVAQFSRTRTGIAMLTAALEADAVPPMDYCNATNAEVAYAWATRLEALARTRDYQSPLPKLMQVLSKLMEGHTEMTDYQGEPL